MGIIIFPSAIYCKPVPKGMRSQKWWQKFKFLVTCLLLRTVSFIASWSFLFLLQICIFMQPNISGSFFLPLSTVDFKQQSLSLISGHTSHLEATQPSSVLGPRHILLTRAESERGCFLVTLQYLIQRSINRLGIPLNANIIGIKTAILWRRWMGMLVSSLRQVCPTVPFPSWFSKHHNWTDGWLE